ncbi:hypothetical protein SteCoe_5886 [Stentor coeruleus]|uniref:Sin1 middle CRIM domain-containing protein n=1 Tax=Stentor coeruleus TaxID=5963 RepID=A0A1R2CR83_9CILI|nr:hypothetical protein SteCoe_5886 [Stentor coeruleus]
MEFSEITELRRVLKSGSTRREPGFQHSLPEKMIDYDTTLQEQLKFSPPCSIPTELNDSLPEEIQINPLIIINKSSDIPFKELQVEKEDNFKETYYESIAKTSTLTQSIMEEARIPRDRRRSSDKTNNLIDLTIYFFATTDTMKISVPLTTTIEQLVGRIIATYLKSDQQKTRPLPKGPIVDAYQIWLIDEDSYFPDTDFTLEKTKTVKDLDTDKLAFCAVSGFGYNRSVSILGQSTVLEGMPLKVFYEDTWVIVGVDKKGTLRDTLSAISEKFSKFGYMNPNEFEFRVEVSLEDTIEKEECILDIDFPISSLTGEELRLYKKIYKDTPADIQGIKKDIHILRNDDEVRYDPTRFNMSRAQACAYKEYEVIKVNNKNKKQKRILGINQLRVFNMTVEQAKQAVKEKAVNDGSKKLFKTKIASFFKSITQHPEIPIVNIHNVYQDPKNLMCLYIDYTENNIRKRKLYETEKSSISAEIVAKISKLMTLVNP